VARLRQRSPKVYGAEEKKSENDKKSFQSSHCSSPTVSGLGFGGGGRKASGGGTHAKLFPGCTPAGALRDRLELNHRADSSKLRGLLPHELPKKVQVLAAQAFLKVHLPTYSKHAHTSDKQPKRT